MTHRETSLMSNPNLTSKEGYRNAYYTHTHTHTHTQIYIYIYIYRERERERETSLTANQNLSHKEGGNMPDRERLD